MYDVKMITDSLNPLNGSRLSTLQLVYPRFIHSEFMTHRVFSRNASSSRAIPVNTIMGTLRFNPVVPVSWGRNQKGMQAREELDTETATKAEMVWLRGRDYAMDTAKELMDLGVHKQIANRVLEPYAYISVICTSTEWVNFFDLRDHMDAQPEIQKLARMMRESMNGSTPRVLGQNEWHLPYITLDDIASVKQEAARRWEADPVACDRDYHGVDSMAEYMALQISAARCARVSYNNHDGSKPDIQADFALAERLYEGKHMSPFEHQAVPCVCPNFHYNLRGYHSQRFLLDRQEAQKVANAMQQRMLMNAFGVEGCKLQ